MRDRAGATLRRQCIGDSDLSALPKNLWGPHILYIDVRFLYIIHSEQIQQDMDMYLDTYLDMDRHKTEIVS